MEEQKQKRELLLSELYQKLKGNLSQEILERYRNRVRALFSKQGRTEEEDMFINDFLSAIVDLKVSEKVIETVQINNPTPSSSAKPSSTEMQLVATDEIVKAQVVKLNELVVIPDKFDGSRSKARRWLDDYERAGASNGWNTATMAKYFQAYLTGAATDWFAIQHDDHTNINWQNTRNAFCRFYVGKDEDLALERSLKDSIQQQNESCTSFIARYARLMKLSDPGVSQMKLVNAIRIRLKSEILERLSSHSILDLESLNTACSSIEDALKAARAAELLRRRQATTAGTSVTNSKFDKSSRTTPKEEREMKTCQRCERTGHIRADCFASTRKDGSELKDEAPKNKPTKKSAINAVIDEDKDDEDDRPTILISKTCSTIIANISSKQSKPTLIVQKIRINGQEIKALIDTGSESSLLNAETASMNGLIPKGPCPVLSGADNTQIKCFGSVKVDVKIVLGDITKTIQGGCFTVAENLCCEAILGMEMLRWLRILIDPENMALQFKPEHKNIVVAEETDVPPRSQKVVNARVPSGLNGDIQTIPYNGGSTDIMVANTIDSIKDGKIKCLVLNLDTKAIRLGEGLQLASYEKMEMVKKKVNATMEIGTTETFVTIGDQLTDVQKRELAEILKENSTAFSINGELGCTNALSHDIELVENAKPFAEPIRRRPLAHQLETKRQIKDMLSKGIIEESSSPWAAAYVLAKKKNGEMRLCVDFRRLNDLTKKCVYPLPNIEECVETLAGKRYFSQLDMASGFWQLPMTPKARELTAFRTEDGHFQFTRMPFGLTNAPASFQRLVNIVFSGLKGLHLQIFIDDLCIASQTWEEHLNMLKEVFRLLIKANLKLKSNKCLFGVSKVTFLGHEISKDGIRQDPIKLKAIKMLPIPTNVKELRSTLGMLNYYRKFVPNYAIITEPLTKLLRKTESFSWGIEQKSAFKEVIDLLLKNGTLSHFRHDAPTALKTDACKIGIAAILLQQYESEWRIVTCRSRRLKSNEVNYSITELEALAIVEAVSKLRNYLLGIRFRIVTDHCALCSVFKNASTNSRLNRWRLIIQEFDFDVIYTKGSMHSDVDCLSRAPIADEVDDLLDDKVLTIHYDSEKSHQCARITTMATPYEKENWLRAQSTDTEALKFEVKAKHRREGFKKSEGFLYKNNKLYTPQSRRKRLLEMAHSSDFANHGGIRATIARLDAFWWPSLETDVIKFVESCLTCQKRKSPRVAPNGTMESFFAEEALQLVAIDCLDLQESLNHKKHVVVAVDTFTRFVVVKAIKSLRGSCFTKFIQDYVGVFGRPKTILTDNAPFFCNELVKEIMSKFEIEHRLSTPHHHQGNGVAERIIQTLQEKLALLVNNPDTSLDWETSLPLAALSINTAVCSSTGFTPYELMFGRKFELMGNLVQLQDRTILDNYTRKREQLDEMNLNAQERQARKKANAKLRYDVRHIPTKFSIGDNVMVRKMGRLSKLSNRWEGPHSIIEVKGENIYKISVPPNKTIERHVSDMKPYHRSCAILIATILSITDTVFPKVFERSQEVLWLNTDKYVSPGYVKFKLQLSHASPCIVLRQMTGPDTTEISRAIQQCEQIYDLNVVQHISSFNSQSNQNKNAHMENQISILQQKPMSSYQRGQGIFLPAIPPGVQLPPQSGQHRVEKRDLGFSATFATYAMVTNIIWKAISRFWPKAAVLELQDHDRQVQKALAELSNKLNITQIAVDAVMGAVVNQAKLIQHNTAEIDQIKYNHPQLMVVTAHLIAQIVEYGSLLERLRISFRLKRPDLQLISQITNTQFLDEIEGDSVPPISVKASAPERFTLELEFAARQKDSLTKVYEVETFDFWANLTEEKAVLMHYEGPKYLIKNPSTNCIKGIGTPKHRWINARCEEPNYEDASLSKWSKLVTTTDPWKHQMHTSVKESWPYVYVYCFPHNISMDNFNTECPPFVHRINASTKFETSDGYAYSPSAVEFATAVELVSSTLEAVHFRNISLSGGDSEVIHKIISLRDQLREAKEKLFLLNFQGGGGISYPQFFILFSGLFLCTVMVGVGFWRSKQTTNRKHAEIKRIVADSIYGARIYETLERKKSLSSHQASHQPTTIINMSNLPTTSAPLPPMSRA